MANEKHQIDVELEEAVARRHLRQSRNNLPLHFGIRSRLCSRAAGRTESQSEKPDYPRPKHAKRLLLSLQENIARYEANVGRINIPQGGSKEGIKGFNMGEA